MKKQKIIWDETTMARKEVIESFDYLLTDALQMNIGRKIVLSKGDFKQALLVIL